MSDDRLEPLPLFPEKAEPPETPPSDEPAQRRRQAEGESSAPSREPQPPVRAGVFSRLLGGLLDLAVAVAVLVWAGAGARWLDVEVELADAAPLALFLLAFSFLYHVVPLAFWGRTPGMAVAGLVSRDRDDGPLTFGQAVRRWLGALVSLGLLGLPTLLAFTGASLTDRLSGSVTWEVD